MRWQMNGIKISPQLMTSPDSGVSKRKGKATGSKGKGATSNHLDPVQGRFNLPCEETPEFYRIFQSIWQFWFNLRDQSSSRTS